MLFRGPTRSWHVCCCGSSFPTPTTPPEKMPASDCELRMPFPASDSHALRKLPLASDHSGFGIHSILRFGSSTISGAIRFRNPTRFASILPEHPSAADPTHAAHPIRCLIHAQSVCNIRKLFLFTTRKQPNSNGKVLRKPFPLPNCYGLCYRMTFCCKFTTTFATKWKFRSKR